MPSPRRLRLLFISVLVLVIVVLYYTSDARRIQDQEFYKTTVDALEAKAAAKKAAADDEGLFAKLRPGKAPLDRSVVEANKQKAEHAAEVPLVDEHEHDDESEEISIAGRKKMKVPKEKGESKGDLQSQTAEEVEDHSAVKEELNSILKRSPIIIFSKSYCPFSRKAKSILVDKYSIVPAPFVVELDHHAQGPQLQKLLAENTGRSTVPNVLINGKSIGGGDDVSKLDEDGELIATVKSLGQKRIMEVAVRTDEST